MLYSDYHGKRRTRREMSSEYFTFVRISRLRTGFFKEGEDPRDGGCTDDKKSLFKIQFQPGKGISREYALFRQHLWPSFPPDEIYANHALHLGGKKDTQGMEQLFRRHVGLGTFFLYVNTKRKKN